MAKKVTKKSIKTYFKHIDMQISDKNVSKIQARLKGDISDARQLAALAALTKHGNRKRVNKSDLKIYYQMFAK